MPCTLTPIQTEVWIIVVLLACWIKDLLRVHATKSYWHNFSPNRIYIERARAKPNRWSMCQIVQLQWLILRCDRNNYGGKFFSFHFIVCPLKVFRNEFGVWTKSEKWKKIRVTEVEKCANEKFMWWYFMCEHFVWCNEL